MTYFVVENDEQGVEEVDEYALVREFRAELEEYYQRIQKFKDQEPDEVLMAIAAITARLTVMRAFLQRINSHRTKFLRTKELDPLIEACEFQFKVYSRILSCRELEYRMAGAGV